MAKDLENLFKESLGNLEGNPSPEHWPNILKQLNQSRFKMRLWLLTLLMTVTLGITWMIYQDKTGPESQPEVLKPASDDPLGSTSQKKYNTFKFEQMERDVPASVEADHNLTTSSDRVLQSIKEKHDSTCINQKFFKAKPLRNIYITNNKPDLPLSIGMNLPNRTNNLQKAKEIIASPAFHKNYYLTTGFAGNLYYNLFSPRTDDYIMINNFDQNNPNRFGTGFSVGLGFDLNQKLGIEVQGLYRQFKQNVAYQYHDLQNKDYQMQLHENSLWVNPEPASGEKIVSHNLNGFGIEVDMLYKHQKSKYFAAGLFAFAQQGTVSYFLNFGYRFRTNLGHKILMNVQPQVSYGLSNHVYENEFYLQNYNAGLEITFNYLLSKRPE